MKIPGRISFLGASTTEGQGDAEMGGYVGRFRAWHQAKSSHNHVFNLGISGDTSADVLARAKVELKPRKTALTILLVGLNDTRHEPNPDSPSKISISEFVENIKSIVRVAQESGEVIVVSVFPIDETKTTPVDFGSIYFFQEDAKLYAAKTKEVCENLGIPYVNVFDQVVKQDYHYLLSADGLHPNAAGHEFIFQAVKDFLISSYD